MWIGKMPCHCPVKSKLSCIYNNESALQTTIMTEQCYVSENGYLFNKDTKTVKKLVDGLVYQRKISSCLDVIRYRILSLRCLLALATQRGFAIYHFVPVDMHEFKVKFNTTYNKSTVVFFKLYFYNLLIEVKKKYTQFERLEARAQKSLPYTVVYTEYDEIFRKSFGIDPVCFGLIISLEIRIHTSTDRIITIENITTALKDSVNVYMTDCIDSEKMSPLPKGVDDTGIQSNSDCDQQNTQPVQIIQKVPPQHYVVKKDTIEYDMRKSRDVQSQPIDYGNLYKYDVDNDKKSLPTENETQVSDTAACDSLMYNTPESILKSRLDEQCAINSQLYDYINLLIGEVTNLKTCLYKNQVIQGQPICQPVCQQVKYVQEQPQEQIQHDQGYTQNDNCY